MTEKSCPACSQVNAKSPNKKQCCALHQQLEALCNNLTVPVPSCEAS